MRKQRVVQVTAEGRDKGKEFLLEEMPVMQAEAWAWRAMGAMARNGIDVPPRIAEMGMAGVLALGLKALVGPNWEEAKPLHDELMACVKIAVPAMPGGREIIEGDIDEVSTLLLLKSEVLELHVGFSVRGYLLRTWELARAIYDMQAASRVTETSTPGSGLSSAEGSPASTS